MLIVTASGRHGPPHHLALTGSPAGGRQGSTRRRRAFFVAAKASERRGNAMITREELKAARKLLGWSQLALSIEADLSIPTLVGFERGQKRTRARTVLRIQRTLERAGVIFLDVGPVRARPAAAE
jgi:DNA-binding XRE family transcriptional regulator